MKNDYKKVIENYKKLDEKGKVCFKNEFRLIEEWDRLEDLSVRSAMASQLLNDIITPEGKSFFSVDWVAKNILKLTDKEIKENREFNTKSKK
jgi:hypothetical protein